MNEVKFLPFALPDISEAEIEEVVAVLRTGWVTTGPKTVEFEKGFSKYLGDSSVECLAVNSATSGLHLALEALGVGAGDEVIVPTYTFTATAEVVRYLGAHPVFVDSDPISYCIDTTKIEYAITEKTKAIIPVHFAGICADMEEILRIAQKHKLKVVEDAAHAFPSKYKGKLIGTLESDATVFSFYATKTITTGEGGMIASKDKGLIARAKIMRLHGISRDVFDRYKSDKPSWFYEVVEPGFKYNLPDICSALGVQQLKRIDEFWNKRQAMAQYYDEALISLPIKLPPRCSMHDGDKHAWHLYPIQLLPNARLKRDEFIMEMAKLKVGCSVHFIPLHRHPVWRDTYNLKNEMYPVAEDLFLNEVSLPLYTLMTLDDQKRVVNCIWNLLG